MSDADVRDLERKAAEGDFNGDDDRCSSCGGRAYDWADARNLCSCGDGQDGTAHWVRYVPPSGRYPGEPFTELLKAHGR